MDYKQQSNQGCLVVDLMYLFGIEPTRDKEQRIFWVTACFAYVRITH